MLILWKSLVCLPFDQFDAIIDFERDYNSCTDGKEEPKNSLDGIISFG
jgi:hypothetical protein